MRKYIAFLMLCALSSCIKPFDIEVDEGEKVLVVNGLITDEKGIYTVKINKTTSYGGHFSDVHKDVLGATVTISDDLGLTETLSEKREGVFETDSLRFQGKIGRTYTLRIKLKNGQEYVSEPELLRPVPAIERLYPDFKEIKTVDDKGSEHSNPVLQMKVDVNDPANERNFYRWISKGTYEVETQPEDFKTQDKNGNLIPAPKNCCRQCWVVRHDYSVNVTSDQQFNGNKLLGYQVTSIPATPQFLNIKYHIELKQYSLSEKVYLFWEMMEKQSTGTGSVQDPAPANPHGNITSLSNPEEKVLGYFGASGVTSKKMFLTQSDLPYRLGRFLFSDDCRVISGATTTRPSFWE